MLAEERRLAGTDERSEGAETRGDEGSGSGEQTEKVIFAVTMSDPESESAMIKILYDHYLEARNADGGRPQIKLESFIQQVAKQAATLKASSGSETLEFRVLKKGDSVSLKARTGKQES